MGTEPVGRLLLRFAMPVVIGLLITRFYILVDGIFVGQALGSAGVAATTIAMPFVTLLQALTMLIGDGGTAVLALRLGAGRRTDASQVLGNALVMLLGAAVLLGGTVFFWADAVLALTGASGAVLQDAKTYLLITFSGTFALGFSLGIDTFLRAAGFPGRTLLVQVAGAVANIALDYLFVIVWDWGIAGAAGATVLGQVSSLAITFFLLFKKDMPFRLRLSDLRPNAHLMFRIAALGMPSFIARSSDAALNIVLNVVVVAYGAFSVIGADDALAAVGAIARISQFAMVPAIGVAIAARPLIGYNSGSGNLARVRSLVWTGIVSGGACLTLGWLLIELCPQLFIGLFNFPEEVERFSIWTLRVTLLALPIIMVRIMGTNYFQARGFARKATILTFCQQIALLLPLIIVAPIALPLFTPASPLESVFWGMLAADILSTLLVGAFLFREPALKRR